MSAKGQMLRSNIKHIICMIKASDEKRAQSTLVEIDDIPAKTTVYYDFRSKKIVSLPALTYNALVQTMFDYHYSYELRALQQGWDFSVMHCPCQCPDTPKYSVIVLGDKVQMVSPQNYKLIKDLT